VWVIVGENVFDGQVLPKRKRLVKQAEYSATATVLQLATALPVGISRTHKKVNSGYVFREEHRPSHEREASLGVSD